MCDVYGEAYFNQKKCLQMGLKREFATIKKMFWVQHSIKNVMLTIFWDMKGFMTIDFFEKKYNCK